MDVPETEDNGRTHKSDANTLSMLLSGHVHHTSNSSHLFWNLEDPMLAQTMS